MSDKEETVTIHLKKELLESEKRERRTKRLRVFLIVLLCLMCLVSGTFIGIYISKKTKGLADAIVTNNKYDRIATYMDSIWLYGNDYEDLDQVMADKTYEGMVDFEDDPYTTYFSKEEAESFSDNINGSYVGIGCQYQAINNVFTIIRVFAGSPAEEAGLEAGDILEAIDDLSVSGFSSSEVKEKIQGTEGTYVKLTVKRGTETLFLNVERRQVNYTAYAYTENDYVVLTLSSFGENTASEIKSYLDNYTDYSKIIIDIRDNTGGYETSVQEVCGLFLGQNKVVLHEIDKDENTREILSTGNTYYDNFKKVIVITNENTASAAEVFTIAMKELHEDCTQIGTTTYGKGVVQVTLPLGDGSYLKVTKSYWTSPENNSFNKTGIEPDIEVKQHELFDTDISEFTYEDTYEYDDNSENIKVAELMLDYIGYDVDRTDGYFDKSCQEALNAFKKDNDLEEDGILDYDTYIALISRVQYSYYTDKSKDNQYQKAIELIEEQ